MYITHECTVLMMDVVQSCGRARALGYSTVRDLGMLRRRRYRPDT